MCVCVCVCVCVNIVVVVVVVVVGGGGSGVVICIRHSLRINQHRFYTFSINPSTRTCDEKHAHLRLISDCVTQVGAAVHDDTRSSFRGLGARILWPRTRIWFVLRSLCGTWRAVLLV